MPPWPLLAVVFLLPPSSLSHEENGLDQLPDYLREDLAGRQAEEVLEEQIAADPTNLAVSGMLLGSVVFNMSLFYLVNHQDPDIKHNSWAVLSSTIAIFVAVLLFNGIQGVVDLLVEIFLKHMVSDELHQHVLIWLRYVQFVIWYMVMYASLRRQAEDSLQHLGEHHEHWQQPRIGTACRPDMEMRQMLTCWAMLFAHMSGFAAISGGRSLQEYPLFAENSLMSLIPVALTMVLELLLFLGMDCILEKQRLHMSEEAWRLVDEFGDEAETDLGGLSLSFLTVRALTFIVLGELPSHGETHGRSLHELRPLSASLSLVSLALAFAMLTMCLVWLSAKVLGSRTGKFARRWYIIFQTVVAMCFAWCLLHAFEWEVARFLKKTIHAGGVVLDSHATIQRVLLAMSVSLASLAMIFALDYLHDLPVTGYIADRAIKKVTTSIGILIGFSWEEAFDAACEAFAQLAGEHWGVILLKLVLGLIVAVVVVPAWRLYILHNLLLLEEREEGHQSPYNCRPQQRHNVTPGQAGEGPSLSRGPNSSRWLSLLTEPSKVSYEPLHNEEQQPASGSTMH